MQNSKVFISYSRKDQTFAKRLAGDLAFHGLDVWWDSWQMRVGDRLDSRIKDAITECKQFVLILSSNAIQSNWVETELVYAMEREAADEDYLILPALIEDVELPPELSNRVYADFRMSYRKGLEELLKRLGSPVDAALMRKLLSDKRTHISAAYAAVSEEKRELYIEQIIGKLHSSGSDEEQGPLREGRLGQDSIQEAGDKV